MIQALIDWILSLIKKPEVVVPLPRWYKIAKNELGVAESPGANHNKRILEYHMVTSLKATDDETPWCSSFVCWCLESDGRVSPRSASARSFIFWGHAMDRPTEGCIVVFKRGLSMTSGHVGFYVSETDTHINCLSGNQGNRVCISAYPKKDLLGFRYPLDQSIV